MKAIAACGSTPENVAKIIMIENQLSKKGAQSRYIADALKHLADFKTKRPQVIQAIREAYDCDKITRDDVFLNVRMTQGIENENEPTWKEVKSMKDTLSGCSPSSPEGIELNLAKATKVSKNIVLGFSKPHENLNPPSHTGRKWDWIFHFGGPLKSAFS